MQPMYYIGLDVHKQKISYCVKDGSGKILDEGSIPATRIDLDRWMKTLPQPWSAAMEATMFSGWIYDHLKPHAAELKVAHPLMLRAIQLLRAVRRGEKIRQHRSTHAAVKTTQQTFTDDIDRSGEDGAALQPELSDAL
jgi:hypothetical protein